jgi:hypothetical protein
MNTSDADREWIRQQSDKIRAARVAQPLRFPARATTDDDVADDTPVAQPDVVPQTGPHAWWR